jgi:hypothetical protein
LPLLLSNCSQSFQEDLNKKDNQGLGSYVKITSPDNNAFLEKRNVAIRGVAFDRGEIKKIEIKIDNGPYKAIPNPSSKWEAVVNIPPGIHTLTTKLTNHKHNVFYSKTILIDNRFIKIQELPFPLSNFSVQKDGDTAYILGGAHFTRRNKLKNTFDPQLSNFSILQLETSKFSIQKKIKTSRSFNRPFFFKKNDSLSVIDNSSEIQIPLSENAIKSAPKPLASESFSKNTRCTKTPDSFLCIPLSKNIKSTAELSISTTTTNIKDESTENSFPIDADRCESVYHNGKIFFFGCLSKGEATNSLYVYLIDQDRYETYENMFAFRRTGIIHAKLGNKLYLFGGYNKNSVLRDIEIFNLDTYNVSSIKGLPVPAHSAGAVVVNNKIYLIGMKNKSHQPVGIYEFSPMN